MLARPWESVPEASEDAAGMRPGGGCGIADVRGALTFVSLSPRVSLRPVEMTLHVSPHVEGLRGTLGLRTRELQGILRTAARGSINSEDWLRQPLLLYKGHQTPLNTKYSFICQ